MFLPFTNTAASYTAGTQEGQRLYFVQDQKCLAKTNHKNPMRFQSTIQTGTGGFLSRTVKYAGYEVVTGALICS